MAKIQKKSKQQFHLIPFFYFPPKDCPSGSHQTIFPQNSRNTETTDGEYPPTDCTDVHRLGGYGIPAIPTQPQNYLPTEFTEPTEVSDARYSPTDCTDAHRLGGYGILPYPRSHQTIFPQKPTQPNHLCASVQSVGGYSPPEASVYICEIRGRLFSTRNFCEFCEFCGRTCANKLGMGSVEGIRRAAWVWQGCHTLLRKLPQIAQMCTD